MKYLLINQETERLWFRPLENEDATIWLEFLKDDNSVKFLGMDLDQSPEERCKEWFMRVEDRYKNNLGGLNALIDKQTGDFIGQCGLLIQQVDGKQELEIGYSLMPQYRNRGFASEAAKKCRDFAFKNNFSDHLISIIHEENTRSKKVARRNGMTLIKRSLFMNLPVEIFGITKMEWENTYND
jgi:[ribosomal protein S5]-alanine N-acetyltransferase